MRTRLAGLVLAVVAFPMWAAATADYWAVNRITGEYSLLEDGGFYHPIGWRAAPANADGTTLSALGLRHTTFHFKIECLLLSATAAAILLVVWLGRKKIANNSMERDKH